MNTKKLGLVIVIVVLIAVPLAFYVNGIFSENMEKSTKQLVTEAVALIEEKGESAFPDFREQGSKWLEGDEYIFVWQTDGIRRVYPPDVTGEGQNMTLLTDFNGKPIGQIFIDVALSNDGEGWIDYQWPKPNETEPSSKKTFIKLAVYEDQKYLVGSGFYTETT
ncbi:MAG: cache domain-containing protein [archaeon]|nr:cache domain-containing protein [Candidatus Bathyarchaeum sp.]